VNSREEVADAYYQANGATKSHHLTSRAANLMERREWILDRDGNLRTPSSMTEEELPEGMVVPPQGRLIHRLGFGRDSLHAREERKSQQAVLEKMGLTFKAAAGVRDLLAGRSEVEADELLRSFREFVRQHDLVDQPGDVEIPAMPNGASADAQRRAAVAQKEALDAPFQMVEQRMRSVKLEEPGQLERVRTYLRGLYTDERGSLRCQICQQPMPFKIKGKDYFEALQFVRKRRQDHYQNRLALCPVCAAKYQHARDTGDDNLIADLLTASTHDDGSMIVEVMLAEQRATIYFAGKHAVDVQAVLAPDGMDLAL
jgi:hypothetical protein